MKAEYLLRSSAAQALYAKVAKLPIVDYHPSVVSTTLQVTSVGIWTHFVEVKCKLHCLRHQIFQEANHAVMLDF